MEHQHGAVDHFVCVCAVDGGIRVVVQAQQVCESRDSHHSVHAPSRIGFANVKFHTAQKNSNLVARAHRGESIFLKEISQTVS